MIHLDWNLIPSKIDCDSFEFIMSGTAMDNKGFGFFSN